MIYELSDLTLHFACPLAVLVVAVFVARVFGGSDSNHGRNRP